MSDALELHATHQVLLLVLKPISMSHEKEEVEKPCILFDVHVQILIAPLHCASSPPMVLRWNENTALRLEKQP